MRTVIAGVCLAVLALASDRVSGQAPAALGFPPEVVFTNDRKPEGPWSIYVIKVPRKSAKYEVQSAHAGGRAIGLATVSKQAAQAAAIFGRPIAGINGDFYERQGLYAGDSRGLQIIDGELISAPTGTASFWLDAIGDPHASNTTSFLQVTFPNGSRGDIGLNEDRQPNDMVLYTPALGASTRTRGGRELILGRVQEQPWLPLRPGKTYRAVVREVRPAGDSPIAPETLVLSIGPALLRSTPQVSAGAELEIATTTQPNLRGARTAISGGPVLVRGGKTVRVRGAGDSYITSSMSERHPRSAVGWNDDFIFLVEVDGRQAASIGMTLNELGSYMAKLGCTDAMNLDGGGSAVLWGGGRVRNRPCDGHERAVANSLLVVEKKTPVASEPSANSQAAPAAN